MAGILNKLRETEGDKERGGTWDELQTTEEASSSPQKSSKHLSTHPRRGTQHLPYSYTECTWRIRVPLSPWVSRGTLRLSLHSRWYEGGGKASKEREAWEEHSLKNMPNSNTGRKEERKGKLFAVLKVPWVLIYSCYQWRGIFFFFFFFYSSQYLRVTAVCETKYTSHNNMAITQTMDLKDAFTQECQ